MLDTLVTNIYIRYEKIYYLINHILLMYFNALRKLIKNLYERNYEIRDDYPICHLCI